MRQNCFASNYAEIAIKSYYKIKELYEKCKADKQNVGALGVIREADNYQMICCVFAEMALESYFNDYTAACLGDKEFFGEFEKLSVMGKFQLIVKFILHKEFDKSKAYYSRLKALVSDRNDLVHNKSTEIKPETIQRNEEDSENTTVPDFDEKEYLESRFSMIKESWMASKEYVKAMICIAQFFYEHDQRSYPYIKLFHGIIDDEECLFAKKFAKEFEIKWGKKMFGLRDL